MHRAACAKSQPAAQSQLNPFCLPLPTCVTVGCRCFPEPLGCLDQQNAYHATDRSCFECNAAHDEMAREGMALDIAATGVPRTVHGAGRAIAATGGDSLTQLLPRTRVPL